MDQSIIIEFRDILGNIHTHKTDSVSVAERMLITALAHMLEHKMKVTGSGFKIISNSRLSSRYSFPIEPHDNLVTFELHHN